MMNISSAIRGLEENTIAKSIRSGGKINCSYTILHELWSQLVTAKQSAELLGEIAGNENFDEIDVKGVGAVAEMLSVWLKIISDDLEQANIEICQAVNARGEVK